MTSLTVCGEVKDEPKIISSGRTPFLSVTLLSRKRGFGSNSMKVFKRYVKVIVYGKAIEELKDMLRAGMMASATGEADVETYEARDGTTKAVLKVVGNVAPVLMEDEIHAAPAPADYGPASEDDVPF